MEGSFVLRITNVPSGSRYYWADYSSGLCYSGWLDITEIWHCPMGAYGATDLRINVVDVNYVTKHSNSGLGPIEDDKSYVYNCNTGVLSEEIIPGFSEFAIGSFSKL